ncbi:nitroreductase family deazaflavin-dependent oxidoreductase [Jongsikchunia kroppenstedtii]|uniref:nitroreductase family deazaflavin-dependent oxidoreductase n=1 Tax=Jongsikchunia kroppenstedtii TaxID=1121721 RepID=UPI0003683CB7|nr:nitroreductase family deazaflavin-dependent oxidoreductase [Jongsikchunia kroppenstedtii]
MTGKARPDQLDSDAVQRGMKWGSRLNTELYRRTGGRLGKTWRIGAGLRKPAPVCLLTTTGRKTGQPRTVPLIYMSDDDNVVFVASQGGRATNPMWFGNIVANPRVTVQIGKIKRDMIARAADQAERDRLWPRLVEVYADYDQYQEWTERSIPVVICSPAD